jgi:predicted nucleotidyltransferase
MYNEVTRAARRGDEGMLTHGDICKAVSDTAARYKIKSAHYFGSYANGTQGDGSDLDVLVEFSSPFVSLFTLAQLSLDLEDKLNIPVDVISLPLPHDTHLVIDKQVRCYGG